MYTAPGSLTNTPQTGSTSAPITYDSYIMKTGIALAVLVAAAAVGVFMLPVTGAMGIIVSSVAALIVVITSAFRLRKGKPTTATTTVLYAVLQGYAMGGVSHIASAGEYGVVGSAIVGTFIVAALCMVAYKSPLVRVTSKFRKVAYISLFAVFILYLVNFVTSFFVAGGIGLHSGPWSMVVSIVVIIIASLNMVVHYDDVNKSVQNKEPDNWVGWGHALNFLILFVWLYLEILRLLSSRQ